MPTQDEIMRQIINLVGAGAGTALSDEVQDALRERYYAWITKKKESVPTSPQEIWDAEAGKKIQKQFEKIGKHLAEKKKPGKADVHEAGRQVEAASDCPHCPDPPSG
jgi:non-homologous end joining protein Ku